MGDFWKSMRSRIPLSEHLMRKGDVVDWRDPLGVQEHWRGSQLSACCPRQEVLTALDDGRIAFVRDPDLAYILAMGNAVHDAIQKHLLKGVLIGSWRCLGCGAVYGSMENPIPEPGRCTSSFDPQTGEHKLCRNHNYVVDVVKDWHLPGFEYQEINMRLTEPYTIYSHPDGILWRGEGAPPDDVDLSSSMFELLEIKSASAKAIHKGYADDEPLKLKPKHDHVRQAQLYLHLMGMKRARILYVNKGEWSLRRAFHEHVIDYDPGFVERELWGDVESIQAAISSRDASLARRACPNSECHRAKECPVSHTCWAMSS